MAAPKKVTWVCSKCGQRVAGTVDKKPMMTKCRNGTATRPHHAYVKN